MLDSTHAQRERRPMKLCECGCGEPTLPAKQTVRKIGWVKGEPLRFINGHQVRAIQRPPLSGDARQRIREAKQGAKHPLWQGDDAGYNAIHKWLRRNHPKAGRCEWCGATAGRTEYAFLPGGRDCTRNRADYAELCVSCHRQYDARDTDGRQMGVEHDR